MTSMRKANITKKAMFRFVSATEVFTWLLFAIIAMNNGKMGSMRDLGTSPEQSSRKQMSAKGLQELIRPHIPELIQKALYLAEHGDNDNVKLGAIKILLAKVLPDLRSAETTGGERISDSRQIVFVNVGNGFMPHSLEPLDSLHTRTTISSDHVIIPT